MACRSMRSSDTGTGARFGVLQSLPCAKRPSPTSRGTSLVSMMPANFGKLDHSPFRRVLGPS